MNICADSYSNAGSFAGMGNENHDVKDSDLIATDSDLIQAIAKAIMGSPQFGGQEEDARWIARDIVDAVPLLMKKD